MKEEIFPFENMVSITDLREDIDSLTKRLAKYSYTCVFKNRTPFFIAVEPTWFKQVIQTKGKRQEEVLVKRKKAAAYFDQIAGEVGNWQAASLVTKMRDQERKKWTK